MTITSSSSSPFAVRSWRGEARFFSTDAYLLGQKGCRLRFERPHVIIQCSLEICEASRTSVPTQPHAEESFPVKVFRFSCSPAARPFGVGEGCLLRLEAMKDSSEGDGSRMESDYNQHLRKRSGSRTLPRCPSRSLSKFYVLNLMDRIKAFFKRPADANAIRIRRRKKLTALLHRRLPWLR
jgi:hypothetical protein